MPGALTSLTCPLPCKLGRARLAAESASELPVRNLVLGGMCHVDSPCVRSGLCPGHDPGERGHFRPSREQAIRVGCGSGG